MLRFSFIFHVSRSADNSVRMFDRRNLTSNGVGSPVHKFEGHKAAVLCVQVLIKQSFFLTLFFKIVLMIRVEVLLAVCL